MPRRAAVACEGDDAAPGEPRGHDWMIPLRDDVPASRPPIVTRAIVVACSLAFVLQLGDPQGDLVERYGMVPARVLDPDVTHVVHGPRGQLVLRIGEAGVPDWLTLLSCTFLHGGWLHFLGNMLFLWIFGDNVEDRFGRLRFLLFYLGCGAAASAAHLLAQPDSPVPTIGASGAIAGVMGAYLLLYPRARVQMLFVFGFFAAVTADAARWRIRQAHVADFHVAEQAVVVSAQETVEPAAIAGFGFAVGDELLLDGIERLRTP